ncbi:MAG TPA: RNA polymerase sigma factor [Bacteroidetes bacterium]|nr:RNA polymerase sigma factor [Bacteroidota bacterium]
MDTEQESYRNIHQDLINECMRGDQQAQFRIYKLYYKSMYNTSLRILNDTLEAEDVIQEAFLSAFEKIGTYRQEVSFGAWLKRIVINRSLDHLKKRKMVFEPVEEKFDMADESGQENGSLTEEELLEKLEIIRNAIDSLPDGYRIILSLYLLEGYDHDEIAGIMNISPSTSRSQYARARKKLLEIIRQS